MIRNQEKLTVGFERKHSRHKLDVQRKLFETHGITRVYSNLDLCIRQRRKGMGDVVAVKRLMLLADPTWPRSKGGLRQSMINALQALEKAGATVLELDTGNRRDDPTVRETMLLRAINELSRSRCIRDVTGRPRRVWSQEQLAIMKLHWESNKHRTNAEAVAAMARDGVKASASQVYKALGKSMRAYGPK